MTNLTPSLNAHQHLKNACSWRAGWRPLLLRASPRDEARLRRVDGFMRDNLDNQVSLAEMAKVVNISQFHFLRVFKRAYGETPFKRLTRLRMEEAQRRLVRGRESVTEIAISCGYENPAHFSAAFRRTFGITPSAYRRVVPQSGSA